MSKILDRLRVNTIGSFPNDTPIDVTSILHVPVGSVTSPSYSFTQGSTTGLYSSVDLEEWIAVDPLINAEWESITSGGGKAFITTQSQPTRRVLSSDDGTTWTQVLSSASANYRMVVYAPEITTFVVVNGLNDTAFLYSPNGTSFFTSAPVPSSDWQWAAWAPEIPLFAAVAINGHPAQVVTSEDGVTWITRTTPQDNNWRSIAWAPEIPLFAAVSDGTGTTETERVMTSPDGINWTTQIAPALSWNNIIWAPELTLFCAVGTLGAIMTSPNGTSWTTRVSGTSSAITGVAWSDTSQQLVASVNSTGYFLSSSNGIDWITVSVPLTQAYIGITWFASENKFVSASFNGTDQILLSRSGIGIVADFLDLFTLSRVRSRLYSSLSIEGSGNDLNISDGNLVVTNSNNTLSFTDEFVVDINGSPSELVVGDQIILSNAIIQTIPGSRLSPSISYINNTGSGVYQPVCIDVWDTIDPLINTQWESITSGANKVFITTQSQPTRRVLSSDDGTTWTQVLSSAAANYRMVVYAPEITTFVVVNGSNDTEFLYSSNGTSFSTSAPVPSSDWQWAAWAPEIPLFAAVAVNGHPAQVVTSEDGITWITRTTPQNNNWRSIAWAPEIPLFAAVSDGTGTTETERVMTSPDGINWTTQIAPVLSWTNIIWAPELTLFCAVGTSGAIMTSANGTSWTTRDSGTSSNITGVAWSVEANRLVASISSSGYFITSRDGIEWNQINVPLTQSYVGITWWAEGNRFVSVSSDGTDQILLSTEGVGLSVNQEEKLSVCTNMSSLNTDFVVNGDLDVGETRVPLEDGKRHIFRYGGSSRIHQVQNGLSSATPNTWIWSVTVGTDDSSLSRLAYFEINMNGCQNDGANAGTRRYAGTLQKVLDTSTTWTLLTLENLTVGDPPNVSIDTVGNYTNTFQVTFTAPATITTNGYNMSVDLKLSGSIYIESVSTSTA